MDLPEDTSPPAPGRPSDAETTGPLVLCVLSHDPAAAIESVLAGQDRILRASGLADLSDILAREPDARALVLYDSAINTLVTGHRQSDAVPSAVLTGWSEQTRDLLALQARNRRRFLMFETRAVLMYADIFSSRLGLGADCADKLATLPRSPVDPVMLSLSHICLQSDPGARRLAAMLQAATTELSNSGPEPGHELDSAVTHYVQTLAMQDELHGEVERLRRKSADLLAMRDSLQARLAQANSDLKAESRHRLATAADLEKASQRIRAVEDELKTTSVALDRASTAKAEAIGERNSLHTRLQDTEADLETQYSRRHAMKAELEEATQRLAALAAEVAAQGAEIEQLHKTKDQLTIRLSDTEHWLQGILASKSYRIMAPVRRLRAAFKRNG